MLPKIWSIIGADPCRMQVTSAMSDLGGLGEAFVRVPLELQSGPFDSARKVS
jgi:hypothetical protein